MPASYLSSSRLRVSDVLELTVYEHEARIGISLFILMVQHKYDLYIFWELYHIQKDHTKAQADSRRFFNAEKAQVQSQPSSWGIRGAWSELDRVFSPSTSVFLRQCYSTNAAYLFINDQRYRYNLSEWQRR